MASKIYNVMFTGNLEKSLTEGLKTKQWKLIEDSK